MRLTTLPGSLATTRLEHAASSQQTWEGRTFAASNAFDRDYRTAWVEDESGDGEGAWLELRFATDRTPPLLGILLVSGFAKNVHMFRSNPRPRQALLSFVCDGGMDRSPFELRYRLELWDRRSPQLFVVGPPHRISLAGWCRVRLTVESVYPGTRYPDTSIAEMRVVFGDERS